MLPASCLKARGGLSAACEFGYAAAGLVFCRIAAKNNQEPNLERLRNATLNSLRGLRHAFLSEPAFREEVILLVLAFPAAWFIAPGAAWFVALIGSLLLVMAIELLNTGIEKLSDHVTPEHHPAIGIVKDYGSAAVGCGLVFAGMVWLTALGIRLGLF